MASRRRTTLGPVSSSGMNRGGRASVGPGAKSGKSSRMSVGGPMRMTVGAASGGGGGGEAAPRGARPSVRASLAPGSAPRPSRKSSVYAGGTSARPADPRPFTTKEFKEGAIHRLITFLAENDYEKRISPKLLTSPTGKDYQSIVSFLFRKLDEGYAMSSGKEDVPLVFKALNYPFGISKTGLQSVGSPTSWPALLASLDWMVELMEYDQLVREAESVEEAEEGGDEKFFFSYLQQSYAAFLHGDDDKFEELDEEIAGVFEEQQSRIRDALEAQRATNAELRAKIAELEAEENARPALESRRADLVSDREKFVKLIASLEEHREKRQAVVDELQGEVEAQETALFAAKERCSAARRTVETQGITLAEVEEMEREKGDIREKQSQAEEARKHAEKSTAELRSELRLACSRLEAAVKDYHDAASELHLLPPDDEFAAACDYELVLQRSKLEEAEGKPSPSEVLGQDVRGRIKPALRELKQTLVQETHKARSETLEQKDRVEEAREVASEIEQRREEALRRARSLEDAFRREREAAERHHASVTDEIERLEEVIAQAKEERDAAIAEANALDARAIRRLEDDLEQERSAMQKERDHKAAQLFQTTATVAKHRQLLLQLLNDCKDRCAEKATTATQEAARRVQDIVAEEEEEEEEEGEGEEVVA